MARSTRSTAPTNEEPFVEKIIDIDVSTEMEGSFLEYAYSVIYSRALPDARDGLKPVQRRILYMMSDMGLQPQHSHVKSQRVVGEVMGKLHPHGDTAIYDALVRMAQAFSLRLPLVDGHGNFGSLDDGPAAARYTEARMAAASVSMTQSLGENVVDFVPNYDAKFMQPEVLPAAFPNLLVNGASGIAVGMATNMAPHNLVEVVSAAKYLLQHPSADLDDLMRFVPGPDLPGGGKIIGLEGIRDAYRTGRGTFRTRATTRIESVNPRRKTIIVTELPHLVGPEKVIEKIKDAVTAKKLQGISNVQDLTDRHHGLRLEIDIKTGFNPEAVLEQLFKLTPMEDSFSINNVALVEGQPRTLGLRELLDVFVQHRLDVVRRRCEFRLAKRRERLHLVEGLLLAILDIDEVIQVIRASDDSEAARERLMQVFDLSELQANYILELRLRRLTKFSRIELDTEKAQLLEEIAELEAILGSDVVLRGVVADELTKVAADFGDARRTVLLEASGVSVPTAKNAAPLEIADEPCYVVLSTTHLVARTAGSERPSRIGDRSAHDGVRAVVLTSGRADLGAVTSRGRVLKFSALDVPTLPDTHGAISISGGMPIAEVVGLEKGETVVTVIPLAQENDTKTQVNGAPTQVLALGTAQGIVKRVTADYPTNRDDFEVIALKDKDFVVGAAYASDAAELVFVTSDAQLLRFGSDKVRPQGRAAGGMAGINVAAGQSVVFFTAIEPQDPEFAVAAPEAVVAGEFQPDLFGEIESAPVTVASPAAVGHEVVVVTLAGAGKGATSIKVTPFTEYPAKGRATGGVRCHRFLKGEDALALAWVGWGPVRASGSAGQPAQVPAAVAKRDASGTPLLTPIAFIG